MKTVLRTAWLIVVLAAAFPAGAQDLLSHDAFADAFIAELHVQAPDLDVRKVDTLHLEAEGPEGEAFQIFLDNAYRNYNADPHSQKDILVSHIAALLESQSALNEPVNLSRIVPVIKDVSFVREMRETALASGGSEEEWQPPAHEPYNADLLILFAEDTDVSVRYLNQEHLKEIDFPTADRRAKSIKNLKALLPKIEAQGADGTYMLSAGGYYEASLLLFDDIWQSGQLPVKGELVVAVPARDILVITGSDDPAGLEIMGRIVSDVIANATYTITDQLFVYRDGRFIRFSH